VKNEVCNEVEVDEWVFVTKEDIELELDTTWNLKNISLIEYFYTSQLLIKQ